jgi:hypothetical protein
MHSNFDDEKSEDSDDSLFATLPLDFPRPTHVGAIGGAQVKLLTTEYRGRFYTPGCTPPELLERWHACQIMAKHLAEKALESKSGKRAHMTQVQILDQYIPRLVAANLTSEAEARWVMRRAAELLDWPIPDSATEPL